MMSVAVEITNYSWSYVFHNLLCLAHYHYKDQFPIVMDLQFVEVDSEFLVFL